MRRLRKEKEQLGLPGVLKDNAGSLGAWINQHGSFPHELREHPTALKQAFSEVGPMLPPPNKSTQV